MTDTPENPLDLAAERKRRSPFDFLINQHKYPLCGRTDRRRGRPPKSEGDENQTEPVGARLGVDWIRDLDEFIAKDRDPRYKTRSDFIVHWVILGIRTEAILSEDLMFRNRVEQLAAFEKSLSYKDDIERQEKHLKGWDRLVEEHTGDLSALRNFRSAIVDFRDGVATEKLYQDTENLITKIDQRLREDSPK